MEEVKDVQTHNPNRFDDEIEIYNLTNTDNVVEIGGRGRVFNAPSWVTIP